MVIAPDRIPSIVQPPLFSSRNGRLADLKQTNHPKTLEDLQQGMIIKVVENKPFAILEEKYEEMARRLDIDRRGRPGYFNTVKMQLTPHLKKRGKINGSNILEVDSQPSTYAKVLALNKPGIPAEIRKETVAGGIAMMWISSDGYLILEERSEDSQINPGVAGPIGGGLDGILAREQEQQTKLINATPEAILEHGMRESNEELGIPWEELYAIQQTPGRMRVAGFVQDTIRGHHDVIVVARSMKTAQQMGDRYFEHKKGHEKKHDPMPKRLFFTKANPDAIRKLLAQSHCTLAPVLQGALLATGRLLLIDQIYHNQEVKNLPDAVQEADQWLKAVQEETENNNLRKDELVKRYNRRERSKRRQQDQENQLRRIIKIKNAKKKESAWSKFWDKKIIGRDVPGFSSQKRLSEQGLPDLQQALTDVKLLEYVTNGVLATPSEDKQIVQSVLFPEFSSQDSQ